MGNCSNEREIHEDVSVPSKAITHPTGDTLNKENFDIDE